MSRRRGQVTAEEQIALPIGDGAFPEGLRYEPDFITDAEERALIDKISVLEFADIRMHGVVAKRRVAHFGWVYGYASWKIERGPAVPDFLIPLRAKSAEALGLKSADALEEVLISEYAPGAGIGWHRDAPMFGPAVLGVSLLNACRMQFRVGRAGARETVDLWLAPRSAYILAGAARRDWQHSIAAVGALRYSITFRTLRADRAGQREKGKRQKLKNDAT
jgi:alkylated DNA repair dioxygenase AlkB